MKRTIAAVSTSRADFSHLISPLHELGKRPDIDVKFIAAGPHLSPEFGMTVDEIENTGITIDKRLECLLSSDTDIGMAKTIGTSILGLADMLGHMRPDLLLLIADRYEMLGPACTALALRIPVAHIEGGEVSEGAIDDSVRNAITKMSHIHFTPTATSKQRVLAMGEESWRVHRVGAPSLDLLKHYELMTLHELSGHLDIELKREFCVVSYHPVTLLRDTLAETDALFSALADIDLQILFCFPNADAGSRQLVTQAREFLSGRSSGRLYVNLSHLCFMSLLSHASVLIGNSSSGIMESPSLKVPTVNIGIRQQGRERAANVIDAKAKQKDIFAAIQKSLEPNFRVTLNHMTNPYGDGHAGSRIATVLADLSIDARLLQKKGLPLREFKDSGTTGNTIFGFDNDG